MKLRKARDSDNKASPVCVVVFLRLCIHFLQALRAWGLHGFRMRYFYFRSQFSQGCTSHYDFTTFTVQQFILEKQCKKFSLFVHNLVWKMKRKKFFTLYFKIVFLRHGENRVTFRHTFTCTFVSSFPGILEKQNDRRTIEGSGWGFVEIRWISLFDPARCLQF